MAVIGPSHTFGRGGWRAEDDSIIFQVDAIQVIKVSVKRTGA
jgi:hypothetical protein